MNKSGIDHELLVEQFSQASAKQGEALRQAVQQAMLKALQGRELTAKSIKDVLKTMTQAASSGAAKSVLGGADIEALLAKAVDGMDAALVQAVEANRRALQQFVDQGVELRETQLKKAMADIEQMEEVLFSTVNKAVGDAAQSVQGPWLSALEGAKLKGTATGASAASAIEQLTQRAREAASNGRALGQRSAEALMGHYAALVSGVLIGMSDGLNQGAESPPPGAARSRKR